MNTFAQYEETVSRARNYDACERSFHQRPVWLEAEGGEERGRQKRKVRRQNASEKNCNLEFCSLTQRKTYFELVEKNMKANELFHDAIYVTDIWILLFDQLRHSDKYVILKFQLHVMFCEIIHSCWYLLQHLCERIFFFWFFLTTSYTFLSLSFIRKAFAREVTT